MSSSALLFFNLSHHTIYLKLCCFLLSSQFLMDFFVVVVLVQCLFHLEILVFVLTSWLRLRMAFHVDFKRNRCNWTSLFVDGLIAFHFCGLCLKDEHIVERLPPFGFGWVFHEKLHLFWLESLAFRHFSCVMPTIG